MSNYLDRATAEARKVHDAVNVASEHGHKAAEEALSAFTKIAERVKDGLEAMLAQSKPYIRQARPYLQDAGAYYDRTRRRMSGRDVGRPVTLAVAGVGAVLMLALLLSPRKTRLEGAPDQPGA